MKFEEIFIKTETMNFWWGEYGLIEVCDEYISIYGDAACKNLIGSCDIYAKPVLQNIMDDEDKEDEDIDKIRDFLESDKVVYDYIYPRTIKEILFNQVRHKAPKNKYGIKPTYIMMWDNVDVLNILEIKRCVNLFLMKFCDAEVENIQFVDVPSYEEALKEYEDIF